MNRKLGASVAAVALAAGLVACSNDEGDVTEVEATETNVETVTSEAADASASDAADASDENAADGDTVELTTEGGEKVLVPAAAANATEELGLGDWGDPVEVESRDDGTTLIEYASDKMIAYSEDGGAVPIIGEISRVWKEQGGLDSDLGLPKAAESVRSDGNGWIQEFANGTIEWLEENGEFTENIS